MGHPTGNRPRITDHPGRRESRDLAHRPRESLPVGGAPYAGSALSRPTPRQPVSDDRQIALLRQWCDLGLDALGAAREEIDALNV